MLGVNKKKHLDRGVFLFTLLMFIIKKIDCLKRQSIF